MKQDTKRKFVEIEDLRKIKAEYAMKACEEDGSNERTNSILWYSSRAIYLYDQMGKSSKIEKDIKEFRAVVGELVLMIS